MPDHLDEGRVVPVDQALGDDANPLAALAPMSIDEINDYAYDESRPTEERIERLREMRDDLAGLDASDVGSDVHELMREIDSAIEMLRRGEREAPLDAASDFDPDDHLESYSPDDVDGIARITGEDEDPETRP